MRIYEPGTVLKLDWPKCDKCTKPVTAKTGYLSMAYIDMPNMYTGKSSPTFGKWRWGHGRCVPQNDYWIPASDLQTEDTAIDWIKHLKGKIWFADTNWRQTWKRFYDVEIDYGKLPTW